MKSLLALLLVAQEPAVEPTAAAPPPAEASAAPLRVIVPSEPRDATLVTAWWDAHRDALPAALPAEPVTALTAFDLAANTVLLGFELSALEELARDGALAAGPDGAVLPLAFESWTPIWSMAGGADRKAIEAFADLLDESWHGGVRLRAVTLEGPEGLILGALARELDIGADVELDRLILASRETETLEAATTPISGVLERLPADTATLAPVRLAVRARRDGKRVSYTIPKEGFLALTLGLGCTRGTTEAAVAQLAAALRGLAGRDLCARLELEPIGPPAAEAPEWLHVVAGNRKVIDPEPAGNLRMRLAARYAAPPPRSLLPESGWLEGLIDGVLLLAAVVLIIVALRKVGGRRRDRRAAPLV